VKVKVKKQNPRNTRKGRKAARIRNEVRVKAQKAQKSRELDHQLSEAFAALPS
jgi:hypothetical protein